MKKFKFTLQSVHNVREMREEKELMVLSQLNIETERASAQLSAVENALGAAVENYNRKAAGGGTLNAMEMEINSRHISALEIRKAAARDELLERQNACARQMTLVTRAAQEVQITGKLRDGQRLSHRQESERYEQNAIDEMVTTGFARKLGESR